VRIVVGDFIKEHDGKLSDEEVKELKQEGYNVSYNEKENKTFIWKNVAKYENELKQQYEEKRRESTIPGMI
jgi:hypothetical protein